MLGTNMRNNCARWGQRLRPRPRRCSGTPGYSLVTVVLAGFGRAAAEVGAVMIVGGNIDGVTRVMTTTISLEASKGDLPLALGLGIILVAVVFAINAAAQIIKSAAVRRYG